VRIKGYIEFLKEGIVTNKDSLLKSINAKQVLMGDVFDGFNSEKFTNIDDLAKDPNFISKLDSKGFKKNNVEYTKDCETFLENTVDIKFFLIFKKEDSELEPKPEYIVFQSRPKAGHWDTIKMYKVRDNIRNFYDGLSSKTIEIKRSGNNYIYRTSNAGNDWTLQNTQNKSDVFKDIMSNAEINALRDGQTTIKTVS